MSLPRSGRRPGGSAVLVCLGLIWSGVSLAGGLDELVVKDAVVEAEKAFKSGDRRHIVVPVCGKDPGEVIPGWPTENTPQNRDAAMKAIESGRRPVSCADLGDDPKLQNYRRALRYADSYNRKMLELEGRPNR